MKNYYSWSGNNKDLQFLLNVSKKSKTPYNDTKATALIATVILINMLAYLVVTN